MRETMKQAPARGWHIPAAVLAVLLTVALWATQLGAVGMWTLTSRELHQRVVLDKETVDSQMERIAAEITAIGEKDGFDPGPVIAAISRESAEELDRQVVSWWTGFGAEGTLGETPTYHMELKEILEKDVKFISSLEAITVNSTIEGVEAQVDAAVRKTAVMVRDELITGGIKRVEGRINVHQALEILRKLPALGGSASFLLAGLIALILSRKIQMAGQYIGGALSGCGLLMLLTLGLLKALKVGVAIGEASAALQMQYAHLARIISIGTICSAVLLMIVGGLLMTWAAKTRRMIA